MHIGEPISCHAHTCIWKGTFMSSTYSWGAIPHHIFIWEAFSCHLWHGYILFFKRLLMLLIHKYTYFEMHYLLFIHFARYFYAIYSHTLQHILMPYIHIYLHTFEKHLPCYLGAKCQSWGSSNPYKKSLFSCFSNPKTKFWIPSHKHVSLHWSYKFGFLSLELHLGTYFESPMLYLHIRNSPTLPILQNHIHTSLGHFTKHLVSACLDINCKRMGTMWHAPLLQNTA